MHSHDLSIISEIILNYDLFRGSNLYDLIEIFDLKIIIHF
jgi:hypothetical protein